MSLALEERMGAHQSQRDYSHINEQKVKVKTEEVPIWTRSNGKILEKEMEFEKRSWCHVEVADFDFRQLVEEKGWTKRRL